MNLARASVAEIRLDGRFAARLTCPAKLVPAPGQYLLASQRGDLTQALAQPVFAAGYWSGGFYAAPPLPAGWQPGLELNLRGPLGRGFSLPLQARQVCLAALSGNSGRLLALLDQALAQKAGVVLLADDPPANLPAALEILPPAALPEILKWAAYTALDLPREALPALLNLLDEQRGRTSRRALGGALAQPEVQALLETPLVCGGRAECGVCAVHLDGTRRVSLACKDGPVFDLL